MKAKREQETQGRVYLALRKALFMVSVTEIDLID